MCTDTTTDRRGQGTGSIVGKGGGGWGGEEKKLMNRLLNRCPDIALTLYLCELRLRKQHKDIISHFK